MYGSYMRHILRNALKYGSFYAQANALRQARHDKGFLGRLLPGSYGHNYLLCWLCLAEWFERGIVEPWRRSSAADDVTIQNVSHVDKCANCKRKLNEL